MLRRVYYLQRLRILAVYVRIQPTLNSTRISFFIDTKMINRQQCLPRIKKGKFCPRLFHTTLVLFNEVIQTIDYRYDNDAEKKIPQHPLCNVEVRPHL